MDEEAVTWNLRGPKRMRKRKDLNKLVKNNARYKGLFKPNSSYDMFNMNSGTSRLLTKSNDSSSDNDDYYFSANKQIIREKRRRNCCKLIQMTILGFMITFVLIVGITLIFSYSKFHEALKDLKDEFQSQKEHNQLSLSEVRRRLNQYDSLYKKDLANIQTTALPLVHLPELKVKNSRSVRSIDASNPRTKQNNTINPVLENQNPENLLKLISIIHNSTLYDHSVNKFQKYNKPNFDNNQKGNSLRYDLLKEIELLYIKPILESLENCKCPVSSRLEYINKSITLKAGN